MKTDDHWFNREEYHRYISDKYQQGYYKQEPIVGSPAEAKSNEEYMNDTRLRKELLKKLDVFRGINKYRMPVQQIYTLIMNGDYKEAVKRYNALRAHHLEGPGPQIVIVTEQDIARGVVKVQEALPMLSVEQLTAMRDALNQSIIHGMKVSDTTLSRTEKEEVDKKVKDTIRLVDDIESILEKMKK